VRGTVQREGDVHVIAERLENLTPMLATIGDMPFRTAMPPPTAPTAAARPARTQARSREK
jgi:hypothetical protein